MTQDPQQGRSSEDGEVEVEPDVETDPAMDDGDSSEWAGEGGAVPDGPATETSDG